MLISHFESKLREASNIKNEGNQQFKAKRYFEARNTYKKALALVQPYIFHGATDLQKGKAAQLRANFIFNIGLCYFNEESWQDAQTSFTQCIAINPYYVKAIYKRALSRYQMANFGRAIQDIRKAYEFDKQSKEISQAYEMIMIKRNQLEGQSDKGKGFDKWWIIGIGVIVAIAVYQSHKHSKQ